MNSMKTGEISVPMMGSMSTTSSSCSFGGGLSAALGDIMVLVVVSMLLLPTAANEEGAPLAMHVASVLAGWWQLKISGKQGRILILSMEYLVGGKIPMQAYVHE
jgi:hypothetical protein